MFKRTLREIVWPIVFKTLVVVGLMRFAYFIANNVDIWTLTWIAVAFGIIISIFLLYMQSESTINHCLKYEKDIPMWQIVIVVLCFSRNFSSDLIAVASAQHLSLWHLADIYTKTGDKDYAEIATKAARRTGYHHGAISSLIDAYGTENQEETLEMFNPKNQTVS